MARWPVDAVLFDLDGTLVDESRSYREAIRLTAEFFLKDAVTPGEVEEIKAVAGFSNDWDATWALIGRRTHGRVLHPDNADRGSYQYGRVVAVFQTYYLGAALWSESSGTEAPFPWTDRLMDRERPLASEADLARLARYRLGIATSRPRAEALLALRQHGFYRHFSPQAVIAAEDAPQKPDPAPLVELARRLRSAHPMYVGDTINDALAAARAGMPFVAVRDLGPAGEATATVASIAELCGLLEEA